MRRFGADFGSILKRFGGPKWTQNRAQICFKSDHGENAKMLNNHWFFNVFGLFRGSKIGQKWTRDRFENGLKLRCEKNTQIWPNNGPRWSQNGPKLGPCWIPKSSWARPSAKKTTPKTGRESSSKTIPSDNVNAAATRCDAESKWPPQGGWGATQLKLSSKN